MLVLKYAPYPYNDIYKDYRFDEPWDGPNNARLAGRIGEYYRRQGVDPDGTDHTGFVAVVGPETAWPGLRPRPNAEVRDEPAETVVVIEAADAKIPWMKPDDLGFDRMSFRINDGTGRGPGSKLGGARALMHSGRVRELPDDLAPDFLRAMLTVQGGEPVDISTVGGKVIDDPPARFKGLDNERSSPMSSARSFPSRPRAGVGTGS